MLCIKCGQLYDENSTLHTCPITFFPPIQPLQKDYSFELNQIIGILNRILNMLERIENTRE